MNVTAHLRSEGRFPENGPAYRVVVGCDFTVADRDTVPAAIAKIRQAMTPATMDQCEGWLVMLQAATAHRTGTDATNAVSYVLYASELRQWPADVAKAACERLARGRPGHVGPVWFPTLAELIQECERLASPRRVMLASLERTPPRLASAAPPSGPREPPGEDEKDQVRKAAADAMERLKATVTAQSRAARVELPSIAGKPDEGGLTPQMRALLARRGMEG